eukprot:366301-Chlamydomonas_euryale.AAC.14
MLSVVCRRPRESWPPGGALGPDGLGLRRGSTLLALARGWRIAGVSAAGSGCGDAPGRGADGSAVPAVGACFSRARSSSQSASMMYLLPRRRAPAAGAGRPSPASVVARRGARDLSALSSTSSAICAASWCARSRSAKRAVSCSRATCSWYARISASSLAAAAAASAFSRALRSLF